MLQEEVRPSLSGPNPPHDILTDINAQPLIGVIIPCYNVANTILTLIDRIGPEVHLIYVVDDCCPQKSGEKVQREGHDPRVEVLFHKRNKGVGGAVRTGLKKAISDHCSIMVKIDGDLQMDPIHIKRFIAPILKRRADYTKGNRFYALHYLERMPRIRLFGNLALSFINKACSGYWNIMDPTNGYLAISYEAATSIDLDKVDNRYFFESDMLFRLGINRCVVKDIPLKAIYQDEKSNLRIKTILITFPHKYSKRLFKRIFYSYFLRDFNMGSLSLIVSFISAFFGICYGGYHWYLSSLNGRPTLTGTIILSELAIIIFIQFLLFFLQFDMTNIPQTPISFDTDAEGARYGDKNEPLYNQ